ncbi:hypothetical protein SORDD17_00932 [Streptococcus oralis]|uniref:Uncharacterized protein n=1 Tax=Streptococcus oralis TaxID=1303 RepID=A0A139RLV9_STROR|nr:hypothetical protein SORDD17_00932 [Streptococcus oralis]
MDKFYFNICILNKILLLGEIKKFSYFLLKWQKNTCEIYFYPLK